jgi:2-phospho-L-lactate transferase/gluconeogenesis factor (CofD/UPF0052 family)
MKKNAKIVAIDDEGRMEITVRFKSTNGLTKEEVNAVVVRAAERAADAIRDLPFVQYGPSNTTVSL